MMAEMCADYGVTLLCEILDCPRSTFYYQQRPFTDDPALIMAVEDILMRWPFFGYRRVLAWLQREGWPVGERQQPFI